MENNRFAYILHSVSVKLILIVMISIVPLVILFVYNNYKSRETLLQQVKNTHKHMLQSYQDQIDGQLRNARAYAINMTLFESDPQIVATSPNEASTRYAMVRMKNSLERDILMNKTIDGYFVRIQELDGHVSHITASNYTAVNGDKIRVIDYLEKVIVGVEPLSEWNVQTIDGEDFLFFAIENKEICAGAYVNLSQLLRQYLSNGRLHLLSNKKRSALEYGSGELPVTVYSQQADFSFTEILSEEEILNALPFMQRYIALITVMLILLVPLLLFVVDRLVAMPMRRLAGAMGHIREGNLDYRIPCDNSSAEMHMVHNTFNDMVKQIKGLKITVYEEELKVQHSQLRNLRMQLRPHFLLNALNMVHSLLETDNISLANRLIHNSIDYFRYMVRFEEDLVPLNEELSHVNAYLEIQSIRYQNKFTYSIESDPLVADMLIPPVLIQNLVENSMKYGIKISSMVDIRIAVTSFEVALFPYARIVVRDTGDGFPSHLLDALNAGEKIANGNGEHVGIRNAVQRLKILFEGRAEWSFYNDNGAVSELVLPATFEDIPQTDRDTDPQ